MIEEPRPDGFVKIKQKVKFSDRVKSKLGFWKQLSGSQKVSLFSLLFLVITLPVGIAVIMNSRLPGLSRAAPATPPTPPSSTPPRAVSRWTFDESTGRIAKDSVGVNNMQVNGATWVEGKKGNALSFDGDDYLFVNDSELEGGIPSRSSGGTKDFSITTYVKLDSSQFRSPILGKQGNQQRGFNFMVQKDRLYFELFSSKRQGSFLTSDTKLDVGKWYHVAVTYNSRKNGSSRAALFIDGQITAQDNNFVSPPNVNNTNLEIGRYNWNNNYNWYMNGYIDEVRVYDQVLTQQQIAQIMQQDL